MTRRKWAKPPQLQWFKERVPAFRIAEAQNNRKVFFKEAYDDWLKNWPNPSPTKVQIAKAGSVQQAERDIYIKKEKVSSNTLWLTK